MGRRKNENIRKIQGTEGKYKEQVEEVIPSLYQSKE